MNVSTINTKPELGLFRLPARSWVTWLGLSAVYLGALLLAFPREQREHWWLLLGPITLAVLVFCHDRTIGRSSPLAAAAFLLGPLVALAQLVYWSGRKPRSIPGYIAGEGVAPGVDILEISFEALMTGLIVSSLAALIFSWYTRAEWLPYHTRWESSEDGPNAAIPTCLAIFGLNHNSSLEDLHNAYRVRVMQEHPDHGGTSEGFKRLQRYYALATKVLKRFGRN